MHRTIRLSLALALVAGAAMLGVPNAVSAPPGGGGGGFFTTQPAQLVATASGVEIKPLLSAGDVVGNFQQTGVMDGLGIYRISSTQIGVMVNHELEGADPTWARVSKLTLSNSGGTLAGSYPIDGSEGYEDFCSSTLTVIGGQPWYTLGEETLTEGKGLALALNANTGQLVEMPWMGRFEHENVIPMATLGLKGKIMVMLTEDEEAGLSQQYAYIANSWADVLAGNGTLYVWVPDNKGDGDPSPDDIEKGQSMTGRFVPVSAADTVSYASLEAKAQSLQAFDFVRPEDGTEAAGQTGAFYMADTGTKNSEDDKGRIYKFQVNSKDWTKATLSITLDSKVDAIINPDNIGSSATSLVIQEDRNSDNRKDATGQMDQGGYSRIFTYNFATKALTAVARVNTPDRDAQQYGGGAWESTGAVDASKFFGSGWWLVAVQAHTQSAPQPGFDLVPNSSSGEASQLILLKIPGSTA